MPRYYHTKHEDGPLALHKVTITTHMFVVAHSSAQAEMLAISACMGPVAPRLRYKFDAVGATADDLEEHDVNTLPPEVVVHDAPEHPVALSNRQWLDLLLEDIQP